MRLIASANNWIEGAAVQQLEKTASLPGMRLAVGLPICIPAKAVPSEVRSQSKAIDIPHWWVTIRLRNRIVENGAQCQETQTSGWRIAYAISTVPGMAMLASSLVLAALSDLDTSVPSARSAAEITLLSYRRSKASRVQKAASDSESAATRSIVRSQRIAWIGEASYASMSHSLEPVVSPLRLTKPLTIWLATITPGIGRQRIAN